MNLQRDKSSFVIFQFGGGTLNACIFFFGSILVMAKLELINQKKTYYLLKTTKTTLFLKNNHAFY